MAEFGAAEAERGRRTLGLLTDATVVAYALWTIAANAVVFLGGTASSLMLAAAGLFGLLAAAIAIALRRGAAAAYFADLAADPLPGPRTGPAGPAWAAVALAALALAGWLLTRNPWVAWIGLALSALAAAYAAREQPFAEFGAPEPAASDVPVAARSGRRELYLLHAIALACALFSLLSYRPRSDDTLYLHLSVAVVDYPDLPLLSVQTLHGPASETLRPQAMFPPYRIHSFELLGGVLSRLTGIEPARVVHFGLATLFSWLLPFALARLLRLLFPRRYLLALLVVMSFYFLEGTASRGYANHALVRMFNGKSVLLSVALPLIWTYGLRFAARPTAWRFGLLALVQVFACGLSSTGLWLAPSAAMVAVLAGVRGPRALLGRGALCVLSSAYVLALGLWVMSQMKLGGLSALELEAAGDGPAAAAVAGQSTQPAPAPGDPRFAQLGEAIAIALGPERTAIALLGVAAVAGPLAPNALAMRLLCALALVVCLGFGNPLLARAIAASVTGETTYYRIFWLLPVPLGLGSCAVSLFCALRRRTSQAYASAFTAAALLGFYAAAVQRLVISEANDAKLQFPPTLKLWSHAHAVAEEVCRLAPVGQHILASQAVLLQLPTVAGCGHPILAHERWISSTRADEQRRAALARYVGTAGDIPSERAAFFLDGLATYHIDAVVLSKDAQGNARVKSLVRLAGFERVGELEWEQIYVRTRPSTQRKLQRVAGAICRQVPPDRSARVLAPFGVADAVAFTSCAEALTAPDRMRSLAQPDFDRLVRLERHTYMAADAEAADEPWLAQELGRLQLDAVVMTSSAQSNRRWKAVLRAAGFIPVQVVQTHTILRRLPRR